MALNPNRIPRPQFKGCPFGCLDWTTCPHAGHARSPVREDEPRRKELKMEPKNVLARKYERARAQRRRDAIKAMEEQT